jgi:CheY-like chemotaxis protein
MSDELHGHQTRAVGGEASFTERALLAKIRHDLRTPINAIIGYSEMLLEDADDERRAAFVPDLHKIHVAGTELLGVVNAVLDPATAPLGGGATSTGIHVDIQEIGTVLRHAMLTPINTVVGYAELLLEDAAELGDTAFLLDLERIHTAATRFLELIDDLVRFQHAHLNAEDERARPTTSFATTDASAMIEDVATSIRSFNTGSTQAWSRYGPVLVVDDNDINRDILSRRLERNSLNVTTATNGREALRMIAAQPFDLVLLDIMMPEMNGLEVLQHLKADANLRDIPVIMISALDEIGSVVRCLEMGAEDYLPKPFNPVVLHARIGTCLEKKRLRDQEVKYLRNVNQVTAAASAIEAGAFDPNSLSGVATRTDELGQLARVFQRMAREVAAREQRLKQQVEELRIEIDEAKKQQQVAEITESDAFHDLLERARRFRAKS